MVMRLTRRDTIEGRIANRNQVQASTPLPTSGTSGLTEGGDEGFGSEGTSAADAPSTPDPISPTSPTPAPSTTSTPSSPSDTSNPINVPSRKKEPTRTPPPQPRQEPTAPPAQTGGPTKPVSASAGRGEDISGKDVQDSRTFATVGGEEAGRRGISRNIQSGRSLFNNPGQNRFQTRGPAQTADAGRRRRGITLTRKVGGSPGSALSSPSGAASNGEDEPGLEEILKRQLGR